MSESKKKSLLFVAAVVALFFTLVFAILMMLGKGVITFQMALLMFVALFGLYVGFGVLIAMYRFVGGLK